MTIRRLTDPERFRTKYYGARRYIDPLPADDRWRPTGDKERLPNCTSIAKEVGSQSFFKKVGESRVPLDALRVADYALGAWDRLTEMPTDERRLALAQSATRDLNRAADRGTAVHALIEALLRGEAPMLLEDEAEAYRDVAEAVAAEFAGTFSHQEVVAFSRGSEHDNFGGTFDAWHAEGAVLADWKTRGPDSQHGCYEKEVAQLGLAQLCDYWIDEEAGEAVRRPVPTFERMMVVSIRPDGFEVFDVDPELAVEVAREALCIHTARRMGASKARKATSAPKQSAAAGTTSPQPTDTDGPAVADGTVEGPPSSPPPDSPPEDSPSSTSSGGRAAPSSSSHRPGAAPGLPTPERLEWFRNRYATVRDGVDVALIQTRWAAAGLELGPKHADQMDAATFDAAVAVLDRLEAEAGLPFGEADPASKPEPRHTPATDAQPEPLRIPAGDGPKTEPGDVDALRRHLGALDDRQRGLVQRWMKEGHRAKRPWWTPGADVVAARHFETARAAIGLAGQERAADDEIARAWIALAISEDQCQRHAPGALLGTLSLDEARRLADITARDNFAAALAATA